jgi:hypothetical protein
MKTKLLILLPVIFLAVGMNLNINIEKRIQPADDNKIIGTYTGLNDRFEFVFKTEQGSVLAFQEISDNVGVDLFDEATVGKKFEITWTELSVNILDDEGEPTGESAFVKRITSIKPV